MLQHLPLFASLSADEVRFLMDHSSNREFQPGAVLYEEGSPSDSFSIVMEGELEIIKSYGSESERVVKTLQRHEIVGEMSLVQQEHHRTATVRARTFVRMLEIPLDVFEGLVRRKPELAYALMRIITRRLNDTENAAVQDLREKNQQLSESLRELQEAQAKLIAKEKLELELSMARQIQESMLPHNLPSLPGWSLAAHWQPAHAVSGDFYDFFAIPDGRMVLIVGDVTDKGVPAALLMTVTRSMLRTAAMQSATPGELLERVNNLLCPEMPNSMFVTCHAAFLDLSSGRLDFANAGHCLPIWCHAGQMIDLRTAGMPLGLLSEMKYTGETVWVEPGDRLLYYSDGLVEAHNPRGEMFSTTRLKSLLAGEMHEHCMSGDHLIAFLLDNLYEFTGREQEQEDDITLVFLDRVV